jgi:hypothetical protein
MIGKIPYLVNMQPGVGGKSGGGNTVRTYYSHAGQYQPA